MSELENPTIVKYENVQRGSTEAGTGEEHLGATRFDEPAMTQDGATYDNSQHYDNGPFEPKDRNIVNVYEGVQINSDEHPYADMEIN